MKYPEYVSLYKPKGTIVKKVNEQYYAYYATSKRVEGKTYPVQVIKGLAGKIDKYGFHELNKAHISTESVIIRECGFTNFLLKFEDLFIMNRKCSKKDSKSLYRSFIVYLSNNSYLVDDTSFKLYKANQFGERFNTSLVRLVTSVNKMIGLDINNLEPLKYICEVHFSNRVFESSLNDQQIKLLNELGIETKDVRRRK